MEVMPCSGVQYAGESDCPQQSSGKSFGLDKESEGIENGKQVQQVERRMDDIMLNLERPQVGRHNGLQAIVGKLPSLEGNGDSQHSDAEVQNLFCGSHAYEDNADVQNYCKDTCLGSENHLILDTIESELPNNSREGESSPLDSTWLEGDESVAVWVKWRGKWQAGIRCARADWPLSTLRAKPTHDRKKYFVIFFPHTRNYSWVDTLLVRSINEYPQPIAYKTHKIGLKMLNDLNVARRFIMQKLAVSMLNIVDQFHTEALTEISRDVSVWKEFAMEASRCSGYSDLGRMLQKLQNMILQRYLKADWLNNSFPSWVERCQNAHSAEAIEMLREELSESILWNDVSSLRDAPGQPTLGYEWKTWKHEVMKWFSTSHPVASVGDLQQLGIDGSLNTSLQVSRKRPKLEVRRAEAHTSQVGRHDSERVIPVDVDSGFFSNRDSANADRFALETRKEEDSKEVTVSRHLPDFITDKWNGVVVETENCGVMETKDVALTPVNEVAVTKSLDSGNKSRQCIAYIESKGRQCVRWANDGDVYCCVHLSSRFIGNTPRSEGAVSNDTPMCGGTTVLGTRCKHRSLQGFSFCKKHIPKNEMNSASNSADNALKRKYDDNISSLETTTGKEIVLAGDFGSPLQVDPLSVMRGDSLQGNRNLVYKPEHPATDYDSTELQHCIGSCLRENINPCLESPRRFSLYCEKHLPSWLKRARNGKSRIVSKEVFVDLLRGCRSQEEKFHLHQACELFYRLFKSALSLRNPVPKEVQFEWALSEASKNVSTGEFFLKLVSSEKDRLRRIWGFTAEEAKTPSTVPDEPAQLSLLFHGNHDNDKAIRCKLCLHEFFDDQALGNHWMDNHKKEAQWLFRGYACAICLDSFTIRKILETHVQERHHVQFVEQCVLLQCIPCGSHFGNSEQLWLHVLSVHPVDFRVSSAAQHTMSIGDESPKKLELCNSASMENTTENMSDFQNFVCKFCGLKFNLLPDLGRHHQSAHMGQSLVSSRPTKRGLRYYAYRLKSGRLSRPGFKTGLTAASYKIRNKANTAIKKRIQAANSLGTGRISVLPNAMESASLGRVAESQCSTVAKILFSEAQKIKPHPNSLDILSVARSTCCRISLKASLEQKYGVLPERLYLKAAKLCSECNIQVDWHRDGFVCSRGCKSFKDPYLLSPLKTLPNGFTDRMPACFSDPTDDDWEMDECHYVIGSHPLRQTSSQNGTVLCGDISFGLETIPVSCIVDNGILNSDPILVGHPEEQNSRPNIPWGSFTYITKPLLHHSLALDTESLQSGCSCSHQTCRPEICDHVYLFGNDYDDAKDIYGKPMSGRFPYDHMGRIILEEGYLVYECNKLCSCSRNCPNRVLQNGVRVKLEIFKTERKGWAVRSVQAIMRGTFVCEYIGEVLDEQEADERRKRYGEDGCSYLYEVDEHINDMSRMVEGQARYAIDATKYGNVSRFINHSCAPNLTSYQILIESMECQRAHIGLYANRDIASGEELTYDYQYTLLPGEGYPCHCGTSTCRGRLY